MKTVFERMAESIDREAQANAWMATEKLGEDGLLHCTVCGGPRQCVITLFGEQKVVRCDCGCRRREDEAAKEVLRKQAIERHRRDCFRGSEATRCRFENDNGHNPELSTTARKYVENFAEYRRKGKGLVLYGPVGTGKSYTAACIANALIDEGYRAVMTNLPEVGREALGTFEKERYFYSLVDCDLLVLDDLGVERRGEYMDETVFGVIDAWYRSGVPLIVTTNLSADELSKTADISQKRVYDRILEQCLPVHVDGISQRRGNARQAWRAMRTDLGLEARK